MRGIQAVKTASVTDDELVARARQGDADAFELLVTRHQAAVYRAAFAALRTREDAEDVTQEAFVRAWGGLARFREAASFRTWVLTIVWNRAIGRRRSLAGWLRAAPLDAASELAASSPSPLQRTACRELEAHAARAIEALTPTLRDALLLANSGEHKYEEIAGMLNVPIGTVKWRVSEARRKVRARLAALGYADAL